MNIASRISRLETRIEIAKCPECIGRGRLVVTYLAQDEPEPPVEGCPHCGKVNHWVVRFVDESLPGNPVQSRCNLTGAKIAAMLAPKTGNTRSS